jgi:metal-responsive CopG/Arc/MetJ family transcriptional regulator
MKRIHISLPEGLLKELDELRKKNFLNRSEMIRALILSYIRMKRRNEPN